MRVLAALLCVVTQVWTVNANVEKTIFLGPSPVILSNGRPSLDDLRLHVLSPSNTILPTHLPVQFPTEAVPRGLESWYLLRGLDEGRRYEARICWPATVSLSPFPVVLHLSMLPLEPHPASARTDPVQQPTDFWLNTYPITHVFDTPELISSLAQYSEKRQDYILQEQDAEEAGSEAAKSVLFLHIQAAASYYSTNRTLMEHPLPVDVDISMRNRTCAMCPS
jgi:hypothetical protein